jgi:hypothetical protein
MGGPTSSYAAASIALEFIGAYKPPHPVTKCFRQVGDTIEGEGSIIVGDKVKIDCMNFTTLHFTFSQLTRVLLQNM